MGKGHLTLKNGCTMSTSIQKIYHDFMQDGHEYFEDHGIHLTKYYMAHPDFIGYDIEDDYVFELLYSKEGITQLHKLKRWDAVEQRYKVVKVYDVC